ncbi:DUF4376 domain-containing protein [Pseudomonas luteola]|uniref:DUF4376 domain-containing protein n=1 Tax=Pseudomonas luteola TaxID=47886 RepID=UPI003A89AB71
MNETIYYVDADGRYLGGFSGVEPPEGAVQVPDAPGDAQQVWNGSGWSDPVIVPTSADVDAERDRRIDAGMMFNGVMYQTRPDDRENILGMSQLAAMAIQGGATEGDLRWADAEEDFEWIAADNSKVPMDAHTVFALGKAAAARKLAHIRAGRTLKDLDSIPADYTDDKWWPADV